jgi:hypothetical protein
MTAIPGLMTRDRNMKDPLYGAGFTLECPHCGRLYDDEDEPRLKVGDPCPDEDCPTYWELAGKPYA